MLAAGGRCFREARAPRRALDEPPGRDGRGHAIALELGAEARDLDALQYHPNGGAWPATMQGYSIPETTRAYGAVLLNADGRGVHRLTRPARRRLPRRSSTRSRQGRGVQTPDGRPGRLARHDAIPEADAEMSLPYMLRRYRGGGHRPALRADPDLPGAPLPERRPRDRRARRDDARGAVRMRRDRRRHPRAEPDDGQLASSSAASSGAVPGGPRPRRRGRERARHRPAEGRRGRRRTPLRLGAEGHPAGPP